MLRGLTIGHDPVSLTLSYWKGLAVFRIASGKVVGKFPECARIPLNMRVSGRFPWEPDADNKPNPTANLGLSQTCLLPIGVEHVRGEGFPPEQSGGPIEA